MNDNEVRMEILFDHYKAARNHKGIPTQKDNAKLSEIDQNDYEFNYGYLADHDLVEASKHYADDGVAVYTPNGGITGSGKDVVEQFIDSCVENTKKTKNKIISVSLSYLEKMGELVTIWSTSSELLQQALELLSRLLGS